MTDRQAYLDTFERHYQALRDDGWPEDRARAQAEVDAAHEVAEKHA